MKALLSIVFGWKLYRARWIHPLTGEEQFTRPMAYDSARRHAYAWYRDRDGRVVPA